MLISESNGNSHRFQASINQRIECVKCPWPKDNPIHQNPPKRKPIHWNRIFARRWRIY